MKWKILCYHTVDPRQSESFAAQLRWFQNKGYPFTPFSEAFAKRTQPGGRCVSVTFDDGDWTACTVARKVLDDEGIRALLFLTTDYVTKSETYAARVVRPAVTWDQLGCWLESGHEIGSHTNTHSDLTKCSAQELMDEVELTREIIKEKLGVTPSHFSYPWGRYNDNVLRWFHSHAHWKSAVAVSGRSNNEQTDPFCLGRYALTADSGLSELRLTILPRAGRLLYRCYCRALTRLRNNQRWIKSVRMGPLKG